MKKTLLAIPLILISFFSLAQNYTVLGNAVAQSGCNCYRLTEAVDNQAGAIFQNQTINLNNSFDYTFDVFLGCNNGNDAADGMAFVLTSNPNGLGSAGGGLGYGGGNQPFSIAIEFDTYQNSQDPSYDHIAIESGGGVNHNIAAPVPALASSANIDNCQSYPVRIVWNVNTNTYSVYFNGVLRLSVVIPNMVNTYFGGNPIVNWGWSAGTGGSNNEHRVCVLNTSSWVAGVNYQSCSPTMQFTDISTSSLGNVQSWAWNFGDGATSTLQNPTHTYAGNGTYNVTLTITDLSGCTNTFTKPVVIAAPITLTPTLVQPPCNGGLNGTIGVTPSGGFGPSAGYGGYTYNWNGGQSTQQSFNGGAGTYTVTVTDGVCTTTAQYTLNQPSALTATTSVTNASCGLSNGSVSLAISGGTPPYNNITWAGFPGATVSNLPAGFYIANFNDANGCSALLQYSATIGSLPCGVNSSVSQVNVPCFGGNNGSATVSVTGASGTPVINWSSGATGPTATNLSAGTYTYTFSDAVPAHTFTGTVIITQPGAAMVADLTTVDVSCNGSANGQAITSVLSGGSPPYNYNWSGGQPNNAVASNLSVGNITVTITDGLGCTATATDIITGPPTFTLSTTTINDSCFNANKGSATAVVSGGNPPYTFYWSNISSAQTNLSLGAGTYTVTVTDSKGCTITSSATINEPSAINYSATQQNINCFGNNNGSVNVSISGGTPAFTYTWNPNTLTGNNPTGLSAGTYLLTVTDALNCANLDTFVITQPTSALTVTTSHTNVSCFGLSDGTVTVNISGGTPPYNFQGNPVPPGTTTLPGLVANTYAGNVVDALNCSVAVSETVTQPTLLSATETHVNVLCNGANTGSINVTVSGGTTPYTFAWSNAATTEDLTALVDGVYTLTVTDANLCTTTLSVTITEPTLLSATETHVNVLCNGANTGSINVTVSGGTTPYTFAWSNAATTEDLTALVDGVYTLTVTDANLCTTTLSVTITEPTLLSATETHVNVLCNGANTGSINVTVSGGTTPYTFAWSNAATTEDLTALVDGVYTLTVTDANLCTTTLSVTITEPTLLSATETHVNVLCNGANTGSINVTVSGGTTPYTFAWSNAATTEDLTALVDGVYTLTVTDANLCTTTLSVTITEPTLLSATETHVNVLCNGANTGSINVTVSGGTTPYTFAWSNAATTEDLTALVDGVYTLTVTDANLCTTTLSVTITEPTLLSATETHVNVLCNGANTGSINVTVSGGTTPYTFAWSNAATTEDLTALVDGVYTLTVTDANLCTTTLSVTITEPALLSATETHVNVLCNGANTGSINVTVSGGTTPYTFAWSNAATTEDLTALVDGVYTLTVTDANLCTTTLSVTITEPTLLSATETHVNVLCNGANTGSINVTVSGGTTPYTFAWSNAATTEDLTALVDGVYTLTVTDANLCTTTLSVTITEPTLLSATETHVNVLCNGANTGSINVTVSGGTTPYTFAWSNAATTEDLTALVDGVYTLTVTDANLCTTTLSVTITEPTLLSATETHVDALCSGANNGSIDLTVSGGIAPYTYLWNNTATTQDLANITAGVYTVTITDLNLCTLTQTATVTEPAAPTMSVTVIDATCFGTNGSATANPGGGLAPFNYTWSSNTVNNATNSFTAGTYTVSAMDANGCNQTASFTINEPADIVIQETHTNVTCFGLSNGDITLTVSNGVGPNYTYAWSPNVSTSNFAGLLAAGTYNITVSDQANCNKTTSVVITEPALPLTINVQSNNITCFGLNNGSITITTTGGTTPYSFNWNPTVSSSNTASNLAANSYNITVSDVNNCSLITNITISEPNQPLTVVNSPTNLSCFGSNDGAIALTTTGGSFPYQYVWSPNVSTSNNATGLAVGSYLVTITDNNGCSTTSSATVTQPTLLTATETHVDVLCFGATTGSITVVANGGTLGTGYVYNWNPNASTTATASALAAGTYHITVSDANNCSITVSSTINEPTAIQLSLASTSTLCFGDGNGSVVATTSGGISPYSYTLTNDNINFTPSSTGQFNNLFAGNYTVAVTDNNNCASSQSIIVTEPNAIMATLNSTNASCYHYTDGEIVTTASGGTGGYVFNSSTGVSNSSGLFSGLAAGDYTITITDQSNCSVTQTATITEPDSVIINILPNPLEVKLGESLQLNTVTNQSGVLTYQWTPGFGLSCDDCSNPVFEGIYSQPYQVVVTTDNGCLGSSSVVVTVVPNYDVFFPNAFTPNGDGANDSWQLFANKKSIKQIEVMVFNRIGEKVFESNDINFSWDGNYKGAEAPNAVYVYVAKIVWLNNHSDSDYKGTITLFR